MSRTTNGKVVREGSTQKRLAILTAASELFLADGFDRTSVDAIAALASVSKRTVYDYFGDKDALLAAVVERTAKSLMTPILAAVDEELVDVTDLESALTRFVTTTAATTISSPEYVALQSLMRAESSHLPELIDSNFSDAPEEAVALRFKELDRLGLLDAPDARLAADHFIALTFVLLVNSFGAPRSDAETRKIIVEGVRAFLRAYGPHSK